jgi:alkylresorcinol/alkylpyrone synthase
VGPKPRLLALATAVPPHVVSQDEAARQARRLFGERRLPRSIDLDQLFRNTGIATRRTVRPIEWYAEPHDWADRNAVYLDAAERLYVEAAERALALAGVAAADIGTIVTVSSTGIATPSLDARLHDRLGFAARVRRVPVFGLGCAGGVSGLALAARLAGTDPDRPVLMVTVELCTLAFRPDEPSKTNVVATALFGDGAAAAVLHAGDGAGGRAVEADGEHLWPGTLDIMGWRVDPVGFGVVLSRSLPDFVLTHLCAAADGVLGEAGIARDRVGRYVCHPGGAKVLPAIEAALGLGDGALDHERAVLAEFGNMSAPTVLFILDRVLAAGEGGRLVLSALGPGFTATLLVLGPAGA